jgi:protease YdgD
MTAPLQLGRRTLLLALALGMLPAGAVERLPVPGITGRDDRTLVRTTEHPWHAIGRLNNTLGPFCTGTLVGPRAGVSP